MRGIMEMARSVELCIPCVTGGAGGGMQGGWCMWVGLGGARPKMHG